ncbi:unnamed protein product [Ranitomeya imitator]|uniref:Uncharacterized protein n=1 Tax=Ranitomeya imitator TaxID=111125 RepID=A0ABN9MWB1_9NEOB|nr:unnamed protein product [Ranitomeya imitator]
MRRTVATCTTILFHDDSMGRPVSEVVGEAHHLQPMDLIHTVHLHHTSNSAAHSKCAHRGGKRNDRWRLCCPHTSSYQHYCHNDHAYSLFPCYSSDHFEHSCGQSCPSAKITHTSPRIQSDYGPERSNLIPIPGHRASPNPMAMEARSENRIRGRLCPSLIGRGNLYDIIVAMANYYDIYVDTVPIAESES